MLEAMQRPPSSLRSASLFGDAPPAPESRSGQEPAKWLPPYALVVLDRNQTSIGRELHYAVPTHLRHAVQLGSAVLVPFGHQQITGYVVALEDECDCDVSKLKPVRDVLGAEPVFDETALKLARWMAAYYHCSLSDCLAGAVPSGLQVASERKYFVCAPEPLRVLRDLSRSPRQAQVVQLLLRSEKPLSQREILKALQKLDATSLNGSGHADAPKRSDPKMAQAGSALKSLLEAGVIASEDQLSNPNVRPRQVLCVRPASTCSEPEREKLERAAPKQSHALQVLEGLAREASAPDWFACAELKREHDIDLGVLRGLEKKKLVEFGAIEQSRASFTRLPASDRGRVQLSEQQHEAVAEIEDAMHAARSDDGSARPEVVLLQGVTASGKTEVYLHAIEKCLTLGRRALVLVPEIALTAQTVEIFQKRFQEKVAILHSALGAGEKFDEWRRARAGEADIVVGARSAIFAPCRDVGLVIIDEEHDGSYKQDASPRYHARDVALRRCALEGAVLVLGSATPSLESYQRAGRGEYRHVKMMQRFAQRPLPEVHIVDMTDEAKNGELPVLSRRLADELVETVGRGEQAIIFLNRRGFATYVQCLSCGHVEQCPNCDVSLTFHKGAQTLKCHHCDFEKQVLHECPQCHGWMIGFTGSGTEKVQSEVEALFQKRGLPNAQVLRLDRDTTANKGAHAQILGQFRQNMAQVLIGTQMVTKGLDFPRVTLVGVISADTALNVPDFRASERTFQLLTQVAGRAGRGDVPGQVLVQALCTDHSAILAAQKHDFEAFVHPELAARREVPYPPFAHVVNVISQDEDEKEARARLERLARRFQAELMKQKARGETPTELLGPVSCPIGRVKNKFRFHLLLRDKSRPRLHQVLGVFDALPRDETQGLTVDVDCMSIL
jgi:primosomal protein N' (replication factor Y)